MRGRSVGGNHSEATSIFVVAASDVARAGLASLVANDVRFTIVGSAPDLQELAARTIDSASFTEYTLPDVVIFDAERQPSESLAALRSFADETVEGSTAALAFIIISAEQSEEVTEAMRAGVVRALLPRTASSGEIVAAIEAVSVGLIALDAETFAHLLSAPTPVVDDLQSAPTYAERLPPGEPDLDALTQREHEVLEMLAEGLSNKEIAWRMKISEHTVKFHVASIFAKLNVSTRTGAVMRGIRQGLIMM